VRRKAAFALSLVLALGGGLEVAHRTRAETVAPVHAPAPERPGPAAQQAQAPKDTCWKQAIAYRGNTIVLRGFDAGSPVRVEHTIAMPADEGVITAHALSRDGMYLATTASRTNSARLWKLSDFSSVELVDRSQDGRIAAVRFDDSGTRLLTGRFDGSASVWRTRDGEQLGQVAAYSPERSTFAWVARDILFVQRGSGSTDTVDAPPSSGLAFSPWGDHLAAVEGNRTIHLYSVADAAQGIAPMVTVHLSEDDSTRVDLGKLWEGEWKLAWTQRSPSGIERHTLDLETAREWKDGGPDGIHTPSQAIDPSTVKIVRPDAPLPRARRSEEPEPPATRSPEHSTW
jgi:WD40 repeat protein